jgi:peptidoglycan hydrolase CwlO-like protein
MEKTLKLILDKLDSLDQKVSAMDKRIIGMDQRITDMDERITGMNQRITYMDERITDMDHRFTAELKRHEDLLNQLTNTVAATNVKLSDTNERMDALETKVDTVIDDVKEIKNSMATKQDLEYYDQMISEHSREIYKLKNN